MIDVDDEAVIDSKPWDHDPETRREQLAELMRRGGFRSFGRAEPTPA